MKKFIVLAKTAFLRKFKSPNKLIVYFNRMLIEYDRNIPPEFLFFFDSFSIIKVYFYL